jgi:hypothetical protein
VCASSRTAAYSFLRVFILVNGAGRVVPECWYSILRADSVLPEEGIDVYRGIADVDATVGKPVGTTLALTHARAHCWTRNRVYAEEFVSGRDGVLLHTRVALKDADFVFANSEELCREHDIMAKRAPFESDLVLLAPSTRDVTIVHRGTEGLAKWW